jgi:hypothetical protein
VLTVREDLIWPLLEVLYPGTREAFGLPGICLSLADKPDELAALAHYWQLINGNRPPSCRGANTLALLAQAVFTLLLRNAKLDDHAASGMRGELKLFQRFNQMIDSHYHSTGRYRITPASCTDRIPADRYLPPLCQPTAEAADLRPPAARGQTAAAVFRQRGQ